MVIELPCNSHSPLNAVGKQTFSLHSPRPASGSIWAHQDSPLPIRCLFISRLHPSIARCDASWNGNARHCCATLCLLPRESRPPRSSAAQGDARIAAMLRRDVYELLRDRACAVAAALLEGSSISDARDGLASKRQANARARACVRHIGLVRPAGSPTPPRLLPLSLVERELQYDFGEASAGHCRPKLPPLCRRPPRTDKNHNPPAAPARSSTGAGCSRRGVSTPTA